MALDLYFKMQRAQEEIERLNIEIRRVITFIRDEGQYLRKKETEYEESQPHLSHQIKLRHNEWRRFNRAHMRRFRDLGMSERFSGTIRPGVNVDAAASGDDGEDMEGGEQVSPSAEDAELEEEEREEEEEAALGHEVDAITHVALD